ncbi:MAG: hypothetical protein V3U98_07880 [Acidobacteriota bacterium]
MTIRAVAPLRIPLGGGGTDLPWYASRSGGFLVSVAIRRHVRVELEAEAGMDPQATSDLRPGSERNGGGSHAASDWVRQAMRHLGMGGGVHVRIDSDAPAGSGLGGSGAVLVALGHALSLWRGEVATPRRLAEQAFRIEHECMGRPVGRQDPYLAAYGGVLALRIHRSGRARPRRLRLPASTVRALERTLLLADTGERRDAARALDSQRRAAEDSAEAVRAMDAIHAIGHEVATLLERGRIDALGEVFRRHWELKRCLSGCTSTAAAQRCLSVALGAGARGGKLIGAGGGGFVLLDCGPERSHIERVLSRAGFEVQRVQIDPRGSRAWRSRPRQRRAA